MINVKTIQISFKCIFCCYRVCGRLFKSRRFYESLKRFEVLEVIEEVLGVPVL